MIRARASLDPGVSSTSPAFSKLRIREPFVRPAAKMSSYFGSHYHILERFLSGVISITSACFLVSACEKCLRY